uniref:Uncharacterized protein n=1 Tax=Anguilla anguilla TaxID=7936 RepID=A0A0E9WZB5_ANGAN
MFIHKSPLDEVDVLRLYNKKKNKKRGDNIVTGSNILPFSLTYSMQDRCKTPPPKMFALIL